MRIKADFVTNSSSTSYIIVPGTKERLERARPRIYSRTKDAYSSKGKYPKVFGNLKKFISYIQGDAYTWIEGIRNAPHQYMWLSEEEFEIGKWFLEQGYAILYAYVPNEKETSLKYALNELKLDYYICIGDTYYIVPSCYENFVEYLKNRKDEHRRR